jgi:ribosome recycling factor
VRVRFPELSKERREELVKHIRKLAEDRRIEIRHARDEANKDIERGFREGDITEDQKFKLKREVQKHVDAEQDRIDELVARKEREVFE